MKLLPWLFVVTLFFLGITGCASLSLVSSTKDSTIPARQYKKLLIVGMAEKQHMRQIFEEVFSSELQKRGFTGIASYKLTGASDRLSREAVIEAVAKSEADGVMTTRLVSVGRKTDVKTGFIMTDRGITDYFGIPVTYATFVHQPVEVLSSTKAVIETNLFDSATGRLVWTGSSNAVDPEGIIKVSRDLSEVVIKAMSKDGFL